MKRTKLISIAFLVVLFMSCRSNHYDKELMLPDGNSGYYLTPLGCLINGPWTVSKLKPEGYNVKLFVGDNEISSVGHPYSDMQKDLVFELHKGGTLTYWLNSENSIGLDTSERQETQRIVRKSTGGDNLRKTYKTGSWNANFGDSTLIIRFGSKNISDLKYKFDNLGNGNVDFKEIFVFDSIYNGSKTTFKKVNTIHYKTLYPTF